MQYNRPDAIVHFTIVDSANLAFKEKDPLIVEVAAKLKRMTCSLSKRPSLVKLATLTGVIQ